MSASGQLLHGPASSQLILWTCAGTKLLRASRVYIPEGRPFISFVTVERGGAPPRHGVPPGAAAIRPRPHDDAGESRRHALHAGERAGRAQTHRGQGTPTRLHRA